ncbi:hypothetical protein [Luteimonas huabeiensis]|uniref:hypothetical protein n=1 Tax=Luteimonas huabeiensis TaxID=1244513 RepID=UPI000465D3DF|nr:hypothetical protein [Luteimonas huabeiensis]
MNAHTETRPARAPAPAPRPLRRHPFAMLLRREFWEHKGGFLWAPAVAGAISLGLTAIFAVVALVAARRAAADGGIVIDGVTVNGLDLSLLMQQLSREDLRELLATLDMSLMMASSWPFIVMAFVVFFYCLGALYDDRKDRSVLFWKSMPVSDRDTVLSKVASALLVAPVLATVAALATMLLFALLLTALVASHGGDAFQLVWAGGAPFKLALYFVAAIPVYAVWALPTVGWLLLCSAWARNKPFLWAVLVPVLLGLFVWWFNAMQLFGAETAWFWKNIVGRLLLGVVPLGWLDSVDVEALAAAGRVDLQGVRGFWSLGMLYSSFLSPKMWAGAIAGAAMIAGAVRLRRWRDEG